MQFPSDDIRGDDMKVLIAALLIGMTPAQAVLATPQDRSVGQALTIWRSTL
jgi:hypothetical protein